MQILSLRLSAVTTCSLFKITVLSIILGSILNCAISAADDNYKTVIVIRMKTQDFRDCMSGDSLDNCIIEALSKAGDSNRLTLTHEEITSATVYTDCITHKEKREITKEHFETEVRREEMPQYDASGQRIHFPLERKYGPEYTVTVKKKETSYGRTYYYKKYEFESVGCMMNYLASSLVPSKCITSPDTGKLINPNHCKVVELRFQKDYLMGNGFEEIGEAPVGEINIGERGGLTIERVMQKHNKDLRLSGFAGIAIPKEAIGWYKGWSIAYVVDGARTLSAKFAFSYLSSSELNISLPSNIKKISIYQLSGYGAGHINIVDKPSLNLSLFAAGGISAGQTKSKPADNCSNYLLGPEVGGGASLMIGRLVVHGQWNFRFYDLFGDNTGQNLSFGVGFFLFDLK